jgi:hypothetical protein
MAIDRGQNTQTRDRRSAQRLLVDGIAGGNGITIDPDTGEMAVNAGTAPENGLSFNGDGELAIDLRNTEPGLELAATGLGVLLAASSGLSFASGLIIDLDANPGLQLAAGGLSIDLDGTTLTLGAAGISVTAPEGRWVVTTVKTGAYNAAAGELVRCDPSGGIFTVTLPTAVGISGRMISVKNVTSSVTAITIATTGGQTIDGAATVTINTGFDSLFFASDGANWLLI